MEHVTRSMDFPISGMQMKMVGHGLDNSESLHFSVSKEQTGLVENIPTDSGFGTLMQSKNRVGHDESSGGSARLSSIWMSNQLDHEDAVMLDNMTQPKTLLPVKRKADMGPTSEGAIPPEVLLPNKRPANLGADISSSGLLQPTASSRRTGPPQPNPGSPRLKTESALSKEMARNDSLSGKSGLPRGRPPKKQTAQIKSASKSQPESSEAVRSKMRESLAAALALASQKLDNVSNTEKDQNNATTIHWNTMGSQDSESNSTMGGNVPSSGSEEGHTSNELAVVGTNNNFRLLSSELPSNENSFNAGDTFQEFNYSSILPDEDTQFSDNFFVKDDLLRGNGLSWVLDFDMQKQEGKEAENSNKQQPVKEVAKEHRDRDEVPILTLENLALKIEAELFKLFGGVNKKYKEKGRSLLFNLKDRNNPELRVRVMSGEISPKRLCSMSAEELASKELSEWRTAKAEELAQMVVLPDTEVDVRRLVKKTHKGEYQVEFERDDGVAVEVSGGTSILTQPEGKKETRTHSPSKASSKDEERVAVQENPSGNQDLSGSVIIQTDGTDLMQGMMVDELKDTEFLPPIVSLDEFMESLNSEPPFENLSTDASQTTPVLREETTKAVNNSQASGRALDSPKEVPTSKIADVFKKNESNMTVKPSESPKPKVLPSSASDSEYLWEGSLQLNISSSVTVRGQFQSGEKTSTKEWLTSIEIKGRVRLDSFKKFLQELPNSRTRAVMVLQFVLKDKSSENQLSDLSEAIDSYIADERLGYAEPAPGVELYLCPVTPRISEILRKYMAKENLETNNSIQYGLIGVVVWRRAHISNNISRNSSSHHKNTFKKQPNRFHDSPNVNVNASSRAPVSVSNNTQPESEEDDDIPPGFGPMAAAPAAKDEEDLPEFNFSGDINANPSLHRISSNHSVKMTQRPVDQVRELIKKYGQSGTNVTSGNQLNNRNLGFEPWDDDDDDIPEWRPQAPHQVHHQPYTVVHGSRPPVNLLHANQHMGPLVNPQLQRGLAHPPPDGRRVQPPGPLHGARWKLQ